MRAWWILLLVLLPLAQAAPEAREVDVRLLTDTTSSGDYGAEGAADAGGLDLLSLDALEGTLPGSLEPAVIFRVAYEGGEPGEQRIDIHGKTSQAFTLHLHTSDLDTWTSDEFHTVRGPFEAGDARIVEGIIAHAALDVSVGEDITGLYVESHLGGEEQDAMPGTWYIGGQEVPAPGEETGEPATYATQGPLETFTAETNVSLLPVGDVELEVFVTSTLEATAQAMTTTVATPEGFTLQDPAPGDFTLDAGTTMKLTFAFSGVALGDVKILLRSDIGTAAQIALPLEGAGMIGAGGNVESGNLEAGDSFQYTFTDAGFFDYHCHPHPWMTGGITIEQQGENVTARAPETFVVKVVEPDPSDPDTWTFEPAELAINPGDTVVWVNDGAMVHDIRGSTGIGSDGHDHDHDHGTAEKDTPAPMLLLPLLVALLRRR